MEKNEKVLILVLVEVPIGEPVSWSFQKLLLKSLNPCFSGSSYRRVNFVNY